MTFLVCAGRTQAKTASRIESFLINDALIGSIFPTAIDDAFFLVMAMALYAQDAPPKRYDCRT